MDELGKTERAGPAYSAPDSAPLTTTPAASDQNLKARVEKVAADFRPLAQETVGPRAPRRPLRRQNASSDLHGTLDLRAQLERGGHDLMRSITQRVFGHASDQAEDQLAEELYQARLEVESAVRKVKSELTRLADEEIEVGKQAAQTRQGSSTDRAKRLDRLEQRQVAIVERREQLLVELKDKKEQLEKFKARVKESPTKEGDNPIMSALQELEKAVAKMEKQFGPAGATGRFDAPQFSKPRLIKIILQDSKARKSLRRGIANYAKAYLDKIPHNIVTRKLFKASKGKSDEFKAIGSGEIAKLARIYGALIFGTDLMATSINVVAASDVQEKVDIEARDTLVQTFEIKYGATRGDEEELRLSDDTFGSFEIKADLTDHIHDGICAGSVLHWSTQVLDKWDQDWPTPLTRLCGGNPPEGSANQAVYEGMRKSSTNIAYEVESPWIHISADYKPPSQLFGEANMIQVRGALEHLFPLHYAARGDSSDNPLRKALDDLKTFNPQEWDQIFDCQNSVRYCKDPQKLKENLMSRGSGEEWADSVDVLVSFCEHHLCSLASYPKIYQMDAEKLLEKMGGEAKKDPTKIITNEARRRFMTGSAPNRRDNEQFAMVAKVRGYDFISKVDVVGSGYTVDSDQQVFNNVDQLGDGVYEIFFELEGGAHAISLVKKGDQAYITDPNIGMIRCLPGKIGDQLHKLLSLDALYPPPKGFNGKREPRNHHIGIFQVTKRPATQ